MTFRIESHPLLDLAFHFPMVWAGEWSVRLEARTLACLALFWIVEDALWFVLNPAFGWAKLNPEHVPWHRHWLLGLPTDYWTFTAAGLALFAGSFLRRTPGDARRYTPGA